MLSGGEQQRLAFVRALIYQPSWLFLDEATSALDEETEAVMYKLVETLMPDTTVVSIGHRSSLCSFHQIWVDLLIKVSTVLLTGLVK